MLVSTSRADLGIYEPVSAALGASEGIETSILLIGEHDAGSLQGDGGIERVPGGVDGDSAVAVGRWLGRVLEATAEILSRTRPDIVVVLGDRTEMHAAASATVPFLIPLAHIHGGELTLGAIDDALRHSLTKLSHIHFVSTERYAERVVQMGEERWRVIVSGAPGLDNVSSVDLMDAGELESELGVPKDGRVALVTMHPETLDPGHETEHLTAMLDALDAWVGRVVFTAPNDDVGRSIILSSIETYVQTHPNAVLIPDSGTRGYLSLMTRADVMVGNSSSGIIEAASFGLPVVNVGHRQDGRIRSANVIDVGHASKEISAAMARACSEGFRDSLAGLVNPYGDGHAGERIAGTLAEIELGPRLLRKGFVDLPEGSE